MGHGLEKTIIEWRTDLEKSSGPGEFSLVVWNMEEFVEDLRSDGHPIPIGAKSIDKFNGMDVFVGRHLERFKFEIHADFCTKPQ